MIMSENTVVWFSSTSLWFFLLATGGCGIVCNSSVLNADMQINENSSSGREGVCEFVYLNSGWIHNLKSCLLLTHVSYLNTTNVCSYRLFRKQLFCKRIRFQSKWKLLNVSLEIFRRSYQLVRYPTSCDYGTVWSLFLRHGSTPSIHQTKLKRYIL